METERVYPEDGLLGYGQMGRGLTSAPQTQSIMDLHDNILQARVNVLASQTREG